MWVSEWQQYGLELPCSWCFIAVLVWQDGVESPHQRDGDVSSTVPNPGTVIFDLVFTHPSIPVLFLIPRAWDEPQYFSTVMCSAMVVYLLRHGPLAAPLDNGRAD